MKNIIIIVIAIAVVGGAAWLLKNQIKVRTDPKVAEFNDQCDKLIQGLQQYKEFFKRYPSGTTAEISKALSGQAEGGVVIMATKNSQKNDKGEIVGLSSGYDWTRKLAIISPGARVQKLLEEYSTKPGP